MSEKTGIIYKATSPFGRSYIGQTINGLKERIAAHYSCAKREDYAFSRALKKYAKEEIVWEVLYENIPLKFLNIMEIWMIVQHDTYNNGYNCTLGGKNPMFGRKHTETTKQKMSEAHKGKKLPDATIQKMREIKKGKKASLKTKKKMSEAQIGRKHSEETLQKLSKTKCGEKNPRAKLTWKKVKEIRNKYKTGEYTQKQLADEYGTLRRNIGKIINYEIWKINIHE